MTKHVGIVACSAEGAALCYRTLCAEAPAVMGEHLHPEVSMHTHPLGEYIVHIRAGNWPGVAGLMRSSAERLAAIGAQVAICTLDSTRLLARAALREALRGATALHHGPDVTSAAPDRTERR